MQPNSQQPVQIPTEQPVPGSDQVAPPQVDPNKKKKKKIIKIVLIIVGVIVLLATIAFAVILVDYVQFQAKTRHEREVAKSAPDYTTPEGMRVVMKTISEKLGTDAPISYISVGPKSVTLEVKKSEGLKQRFMIDQDTWREYSEKERHKTEKEMPLSSINLEASWNKIVPASSCTDPQAMSLRVMATSVVATDLLCGTDNNQVVYTMNSKGKILENVDLRTADGIYAAWLDVLEVLPNNERVSVWGVSLADSKNKGGLLTSVSSSVTVARDGVQGELLKDSAILRQNYNTVPSTSPGIKASDITADVIKQGLAAYAQKCPGIELRAIGLQIPTGYPQYPAWISYSDLDTCVYEQRLANSDA